MKRITEWRPIAVRRIGRQRLGWEGDVREIWEEGRFRIGVRWLWREKNGRELLGKPKLIERCCDTRRRRRKRRRRRRRKRGLFDGLSV